MSDDADIAAENQQRLNEAALARRREAAAKRESAEYCIDCDEPIPARRRVIARW
jgi:RNA polymerase-binding transcription factor DksA